MHESSSTPLQRILQVIPDLQISSLRAGEDGLVNDVLIVNEELVFRFAREEAARPGLEREAQLLAFLRPRLRLPVPELIQQHLDCTVYRFIPGVPLDRQRLLAQDATARRRILEELGAFLPPCSLHPRARPGHPPSTPAIFVSRWARLRAYSAGPAPSSVCCFGRHRGPGRAFADLRRQYQATLAAGAQAGRFAPRVQPPPIDLAAGQDAILGRLAATVRAVQIAVQRWPEPALDQYRLPHPLLGRLTVREMLAFSVYHHAHHLRRVAERSQDGRGHGA
jgi:hypothetical protein